MRLEANKKFYNSCKVVKFLFFGSAYHLIAIKVPFSDFFLSSPYMIARSNLLQKIIMIYNSALVLKFQACFATDVMSKNQKDLIESQCLCV